MSDPPTTHSLRTGHSSGESVVFSKDLGVHLPCRTSSLHTCFVLFFFIISVSVLVVSGILLHTNIESTRKILLKRDGVAHQWDEFYSRERKTQLSNIAKTFYQHSMESAVRLKSNTRFEEKGPQ